MVKFGQQWHTPKLFEKLCEFKGENNERTWGMFPNLKHFEGKKGMLKL